MKWFQINNELHSPEGEGAPGGGGGDKDKSAEDVTVLKTSIQKLEEKNNQLLEENRRVKDSLKPWEGLDPNRIKNLLTQLEGDEEMKLISEGKHDEVIKKRTEKLQAQHQSQLEALSGEVTTYKTELEKTKSQVQKLLIDNTAVTAFVKAGGLETAVEDVVLRATREFKIEDGTPIKRDAKGEIVRGKDGPITLAEWAEKLRETAPHLFPGSSGANSNGNRGSGGNTIDDQITAARKAGDIELMRELKDKKRRMAESERNK
jgi:hypothetical protein